MVMTSLIWMWSLSGSSKSSSAHMSVGMVWRRRQGWNEEQQVEQNAKLGHPSCLFSTYLEQELAQGRKGRPVVWFLSPALQHDVVDVLRTVFRLREAFPLFIDLVQNLS